MNKFDEYDKIVETTMYGMWHLVREDNMDSISLWHINPLKPTHRYIVHIAMLLRGITSMPININCNKLWRPIWNFIFRKNGFTFKPMVSINCEEYLNALYKHFTKEDILQVYKIYYK